MGRLCRSPGIWPRAALMSTWILALPVCAQGAGAEGTLTVLWTERVPFQYMGEDGRAKGVLVDLGRKVLSRAGIGFSEAMLPANRVIIELRDNERPACAIGWYKSEERQAIAQFSQPVYQDLPLRGVFRSDFVIKPGVAAATMFSDLKVRILLKQGFAYGPYLDGLIAKTSPEQLQRVTGDSGNLLKMLAANRADVVFLAQEEIDFYGKSDPAFVKDFKVMVFKDMPEMDKRFIMCSKRVTPEMMKKINTAIAASTSLR